MSNEIVKKETGTMADLKQDIELAIRDIAPKYLNTGRMIALALEQRKRPELAESSIASVFEFCKKCAEWGTDKIGAGGVWPVPYKNRELGTVEMQAQADWRLIIAKAVESGAIKHANPDVVYEGDIFVAEQGLTPIFRHVKQYKSKKITHAYCLYILPDGTKDFVVMGRDELLEIRDSSKAYIYAKKKEETIWGKWEGEMCKKTVVKRAMKPFEGFSTELSNLLAYDNQLIGNVNFTNRTPIQPTIAQAEGKPIDVTPVEEKPAEETPQQTQEPEPPSKPEPKRMTKETIREVVDKLPTKMPDYVGPVQYKTFQTKTGKTQHVAISPEEEQMSTLRSSYGEIIKQADETGADVRIWIEMNGKYKNIADIELVTDMSEHDKLPEAVTNGEPEREEPPF